MRPTVSIITEYQLPDSECISFFDDILRKIAKKYSGTETGSGFYFKDATRDINFEFKNLANAQKFLYRVKRFKRVKKVYSKSYLCDEDLYG